MSNTVTNEGVKVFDKVAFIHVDISIPTGKKELKDKSLIGIQKDPDKKLFPSIGVLQYVDVSTLTPLNSLRSAVEDACRAVGFRFAGLWCVPLDKLAKLQERLNELKADFQVLRREFVRKYPGEVAAQAAVAAEKGIPNFGAEAPEIHTIEARTYFSTRVLKMSNVESGEGGGDATSVELSMVDQIFHDVAVDAKQLWDQSIKADPKNKDPDAPRKSTLTHRIRAPFERFKEKLGGLAFLNPAIKVLIDRIDQVFEMLPPKGQKIEDKPLMAIQGLCLLLKDKQAILDFVADVQATGQMPDVLPALSTAQQSLLPTDPTQVPSQDVAEVAVPVQPSAEPAPLVAGWFGV